MPDNLIDWLGDVPEHWRLMRLGRVTVSRCDGPFGSGLKSDHYTESGVRVIRLQNIRRDGFDGTDEAIWSKFIGGKVPVTILFGAEEPVMAEIRRLNNGPGHLQFRYENKAQERIRLWLTAVFGGPAAGNLLEIVEVAPFTFLFKPILWVCAFRVKKPASMVHKRQK